MSLSAALTQEHRDIDGGLEVFVTGLDRGLVDPAPLRRALGALRRHIYLEEEMVFPAIRRAGMVMPVLVMVREHGQLWQLMDSLTELVDADDPADTAQLRSVCRDLLDRLEKHNSKEEPIIYPQVEADLTEVAADELAGFLESGAMPDGWVCEAAR